MSFSEFASIVTFGSNIAVVVTLIILIFQLRQSNRSQRALMNQGVYTRATGVVMFYAQPEMSKLIARLIEGESDFSPHEIVQLSDSLRLTLFELQDGYLQHEAGFLDEIPFDGIVRGALRGLSRPVFRALWLDAKANFPANFVLWVDELIEAEPVAGPVKLVDRLRDNVSKIQALG